MASLLGFGRKASRPQKAGKPQRGPVPDFAKLAAAGGGFAIPRTEERGITVPQLGAMLEFFEEMVGSSGDWVSRKGEKLEWNTASLYDIVEHLVKPATQKKHCSYVEMVANGPQLPKWFVSHWWGQKTVEFARCLLQHSEDRALGEDVAYWVCAFAAIQWSADDEPDWIAPDWVNMYASNEWYNPEASPFQRAMRLSQGTLSIIDSDAGYFERVWCCYEIWSTLMLAAAANLYGDVPIDAEDNGYKYDIYTCVNEDLAVGLTDGFAQVDMRRAKHWWTNNKYHREKAFPIELARSALSLKLELGKATQETDRVHILNSIVGASNLDATPPKEHPRYDQLNNTLRGRFAAAVWRKAFEAGECMKEYGRVLEASSLMNLAISFDSCQELDDLAARALSAGLSPAIRMLDLDFNGCTRLTDDGVEALATALPASIRNLRIDLSGCKFADLGMKALANSLRRQDHEGHGYSQTIQATEPSEVSFSLASEAWELVPLLQVSHGVPTADAQIALGMPVAGAQPARRTQPVMEDLSLSFAGCGHLSEASIETVVCALPRNLKRLELNFYGCIALGDSCLEALAAALPSTLLYFELRVARCPDVSDAGVQSLAKGLPPGLQHFTLDLRFCIKLTDASARALATHLPLVMRHLEIDLVSCTSTTVASEEVLQKVEAERKGLKLTFWGKDDFAVNM